MAQVDRVSVTMGIMTLGSGRSCQICTDRSTLYVFLYRRFGTFGRVAGGTACRRTTHPGGLPSWRLLQQAAPARAPS